jgi:hypothetical protein
MTTFYIHEDDWAMIDLVPVDNAAESARVAAEADAHAEAHRAPDGVGWTAMYVIPAPSVPLQARGLTLEMVRATVGAAFGAPRAVTSGYSSYREEVARGFALEGDGGVLYGTTDEAGVVDGLHVYTASEEPAFTAALVALGRTHRLILLDWWRHAQVDLSDADAVARWLAPPEDDVG